MTRIQVVSNARAMFNAEMDETQTISPKTPASWVRLPGPLWIFSAAVLIGVVAAGLRAGLPMYREQAAKAAIEKLGSRVEIGKGGADWLRRCIGNDRMEPFDHVVSVDFNGRAITDAGVAELEQDLPRVYIRH